MGNNEGTLKLLREIFQEDVVIFQGNRYMFIPIIEGLNRNEIDNNQIKKE